MYTDSTGYSVITHRVRGPRDCATGVLPTRIVLAVLACLQCACAAKITTPVRPLPAEHYGESGKSAYIWSSGFSRQSFLAMNDYAVVVSIDGVALPSEYVPAADSAPVVAWALEVPTGKHVVEILDKETMICLPSYLGAVCITPGKSRRTIELEALEARTYTPLIDERCGRKWFWIADSGPWTAGASARIWLKPSEPNLPVVAGESPHDVECAQANTGN